MYNKKIGCTEWLLKMSSITYKEDILKELSEELGIPYKEVEEIVELNISYLKDTIKNTDNLIINIPNLCKLRMNNRLALSYVHNNGKSKFKKRLDKVENLKRKLQSFTTYTENSDDWQFLLNVKKPLFERLWKKSSKSKYINRITRKMYDIIENLEKETNKIIHKIK